MKKKIPAFTILFLLLPSFLLAQEVVDMNLKVRLAVELLSEDIISKDKVRNLNYEELKHECSIPLSFGIYKYDFSITHTMPGLFILEKGEITILTDYEYQEVFQKFDSLFIKNDLEYNDRLIYLSKIFDVLHERHNSGGEIIPNWFDLDAELDMDKKLEHPDSTDNN